MQREAGETKGGDWSRRLSSLEPGLWRGRVGGEEVEEKGQRRRKREENVVHEEEDISWLANPKRCDLDMPCFFGSRAASRFSPG